MNRISHTFPDVETLLDDLCPKRPVEALLVHRVWLIELFKHTLAELHERRRVLEGTPGEADTVRRIKYWDDVLGWVKERRGQDVILTDGATEARG
jgi:hypothetical protein